MNSNDITTDRGSATSKLSGCRGADAGGAAKRTVPVQSLAAHQFAPVPAPLRKRPLDVLDERTVLQLTTGRVATTVLQHDGRWATRVESLRLLRASAAEFEAHGYPALIEASRGISRAHPVLQRLRHSRLRSTLEATDVVGGTLSDTPAKETKTPPPSPEAGPVKKTPKRQPKKPAAATKKAARPWARCCSLVFGSLMLVGGLLGAVASLSVSSGGEDVADVAPPKLVDELPFLVHLLPTRARGTTERLAKVTAELETLPAMGSDVCIDEDAAASGVAPTAVEQPFSSSVPDEIQPPVAWPQVGAAEARPSGGRGRAATWLGVAAVAVTRRLELAVFVCMWAPAEASGVFTDTAALQAAVDDLTTAEATHGPIAGWDVSRVDNMGWCCFSSECSCCTCNPTRFFPASFNGDISKWDTGRVTSMEGTFNQAKAFNRPLAWDTSQVTTMESTFQDAQAFNQPLAWDTSKVTVFRSMFDRASSFNADVSKCSP